MSNLKIASFFLLATVACGGASAEFNSESEIVAPEPECLGGDCDDVDGEGKFCTGAFVCHSFVKGYRLPTTLPNGQRSCPPGYTLKQLDAPNTSRVDACDAANAYAWPLPCEIGCYGDVDLDPPVVPTINGGCCEYKYVRRCEPLPACTADVDAASY